MGSCIRQGAATAPPEAPGTRLDNSDNVIGVDNTTGWSGLDPAFTFAGGWPAKNVSHLRPSSLQLMDLTAAPDPFYLLTRIPQIQNATISIQRELPGQISLMPPRSGLRDKTWLAA